MRFLIGLFTLFMLATPSFAQSYFLSQGDVIAVEVLEDTSLNRTAIVLPDGNIVFPFAGSIKAEGRTIGQVQQSLENALAPNFAAKPTVFVSIAQLASASAAAAAPTTGPLIRIYAIGQVNNPGPIDIDSGINFLQALASVGGFTPFAATKRIQLRRTDPATGQEQIYKFNLKAAGQGAAIAGNTTMREGDIIFVPERRLFE